MQRCPQTEYNETPFCIWSFLEIKCDSLEESYVLAGICNKSFYNLLWCDGALLTIVEHIHKFSTLKLRYLLCWLPI